MRPQISFKLLIFILILLLAGNLALLDYKIFTQSKFEKTSRVSKEEALPTPAAAFQVTPPTTPLTPTNICPSACFAAMESATASVLTKIPKTTTQTQIQSVPSQIKIFYIPLGSGTSASTSWTDIPTAESYFDPVNYGKIKSIRFEASLRIPSGNGRVYARLYNVNDKLSYFESEVWAEGAKGQVVESQELKERLTAGNKLYRVQLRTTMGYEGSLDLGRLKIQVE